MIHPPAEQAIRRRIGTSATLALAGLALSVSDAATVGGWVTIGALIMLLAALHRYGRQGADPG